MPSFEASYLNGDRETISADEMRTVGSPVKHVFIVGQVETRSLYAHALREIPRQLADQHSVKEK